MEDVIQDLGEKLFGGFTPADGLSEIELARVEARLGIKLPATLRTFYLLVGNNKVITRAHNRFMRPRSLSMYNNALVFLEQNQKVMFWGILRDDLIIYDPAVHQGNPEETEWYPDGDFLSAFLLGIVGWQAANGMPWTAEGVKDERLVERIRADLIYADPGVDDTVNDLTTFYEKGLVVSISRTAKKFLVGANDVDGLDYFEKRFSTSLNHL